MNGAGNSQSAPHRIVVGQDILDIELLTDADSDNLKNSTYDLTIGEIVPVGRNAIQALEKSNKPLSYYRLKPREMVWVLSKETFKLPGTVTGLATLRTTHTKLGLLALNVGILDPYFEGPISTILLNFSDKTRRIAVGEKFFRLLFFEHADTAQWKSEYKITRTEYSAQLKEWSTYDFPSNFMDLKDHTAEWQANLFGSMLLAFVRKRWLRSIIVALVLLLAAVSSTDPLHRIGLLPDFLERLLYPDTEIS
jgi:deoxycytidine triphosphate deaminase